MENSSSQSVYTINYWIPKTCTLAVFCCLIVIFCLIWLIQVIRHLIQHIKLFQFNKQKLFRDNRERHHILYNLETHIVKDIILIVLCIGEFCEPFFGLMISFTQFANVGRGQVPKVAIPLVPTTILPHCSFTETLEDINTNANKNIFQTWEMYLFIAKVMGCIGFLRLSSFLTVYLAKRYFSHRILKSVYSHVLSFLIQFIFVIILCNSNLFIFYYIITPILIMINWYILLKNCITLRKVLISNLRDLRLQFTRSGLVKEQSEVLRIYKVFMPILLTALFLGALSILIHFYTSMVMIFFNSGCFMNFIPLSTLLRVQVYQVLVLIFLVVFSIHFVLLGLPLYAATIGMFSIACYKRFYKKTTYRYNYINLKSELRKKFKIDPPFF